MDNILLTICARAGSKGVKNKNIRMLNGKPLISYTIKQGLKWKKAQRVIVSTDLVEIASISKKYGAEVPFIRPNGLATDYAAKLPVIRHALLQCESIYNEQYSIIVDLDPTAPVRKIDDLDNCLEMFQKEKCDTLFSVVEAHKNPYFNMVEIYPDGKIRLSKPLNNSMVRRQDAPKVYSLNASIYLYSREYLLNENNTTCISDNSAIYIMDEIAGIDIDREIDCEFIDFLIREGFVSL